MSRKVSLNDINWPPGPIQRSRFQFNSAQLRAGLSLVQFSSVQFSFGQFNSIHVAHNSEGAAWPPANLDSWSAGGSLGSS